MRPASASRVHSQCCGTSGWRCRRGSTIICRCKLLTLPKRERGRRQRARRHRRCPAREAHAMRPLEGLFVLDFSTLLPGPMATLLLAEAGAEVVKIERPGRGEEMRGHAPKWGPDSVSFALLNRGKRSVALDLKNPADR